jgi:hypothetical protein
MFAIFRTFGPRGDPLLKWIGFAVTFAFVIVFGLAICSFVEWVNTILTPLALLLLIVVTGIYFAPFIFAPSIIAFARRHQKRGLSPVAAIRSISRHRS